MDALPEQVRQEIVMKAADIDGHSVTTYRFHSSDAPEDLKDVVARHFRQAGRHVIATTRGAWQIVSARDEQGIATVQLRATARGSEGLASQWRPVASAPRVASPVRDWLPARARVIREVGHQDPGRDAGTLVAMVDEAPERAADQLKRRAQADGFQPDPVLGMPAQGAAWFRGGGPLSGQAFALRRGVEEVIATVSVHRDSTAVVLHWSRAR